MEAESGELCGIPGEDDEAITKGEFNRLTSVVRFYHFRPMRTEMKEVKQMIQATHTLLQEHIEADREFFAKLAGAKWALYAIALVLAPVAPVVYYLIQALTVAGIL